MGSDAIERDESCQGDQEARISPIRPRASARKKTRYVRIILGWLVALVALYLIYRKIDVSSALASLGKASVGLLAVAVLLTLAGYAIRVFKWYIVLRGEYPLIEIAVLFFSSRAFGDLSPARMGEFAPLLSGKYRSGKVAALLLVDRFFEAYASFFYGIVGILLLGFQDVRVTVAGGVVLLISCLVFVLLINARFWKQVQDRVKKWALLARAVGIVVVVSEGFGTFRQLSWALWLLSMVAKTTGLFFFQVLFLSVGVQVSWPLVATMVFVAAVAALVAFTPWGLGIVEAPIWWLGRMYDLPPEGIGAFYVLVRGIPLLSTWSFYGLTLLISRFQRE